MTSRLLDLFAGAGGCSVGYARAGFDVTGVDIEPHPDYPFHLIVADAMDVLTDAAFLSGFDVIHASPPCPRYSTVTPKAAKDRHPDLLPIVRDALRAWGGTYVIENVPGAAPHMVTPALLCGSAFHLGVRRHRLFESSEWILSPGCWHRSGVQPVGVYGDHGEDRQHYRPNGQRRGRKARDAQHAGEALGIDWMTHWDDLADAIPPAYTEHIGIQIRLQMEAEATA